MEKQNRNNVVPEASRDTKKTNINPLDQENHNSSSLDSANNYVDWHLPASRSIPILQDDQHSFWNDPSSSHTSAQNPESKLSNFEKRSFSLEKQEGTTQIGSDRPTKENKQEVCNYAHSPPELPSESRSSDPFLPKSELSADDGIGLQEAEDGFVQDDPQLMANLPLTTESADFYQSYFSNFWGHSSSRSEAAMDMYLENSMHVKGASEQDYHSTVRDIRGPSDLVERLQAQNTGEYYPPSSATSTSANRDLQDSNDSCILISVRPVPEDSRASGDRYTPSVVIVEDDDTDGSSEHSYNLVSDKSDEASDLDEDMAERESSTQGPVQEDSSCKEVGRGSHFLAGSTNQFDPSEDNTMSNNCGLTWFRECSANPKSAYADATVYHIITEPRETEYFTNPTNERLSADCRSITSYLMTSLIQEVTETILPQPHDSMSVTLPSVMLGTPMSSVECAPGNTSTPYSSNSLQKTMLAQTKDSQHSSSYSVPPNFMGTGQSSMTSTSRSDHINLDHSCPLLSTEPLQDHQSVLNDNSLPFEEQETKTTDTPSQLIASASASNTSQVDIDCSQCQQSQQSSQENHPENSLLPLLQIEDVDLFFDNSSEHTCSLTSESFGEASDSDAEMAGSESSSPGPGPEEIPCSEVCDSTNSPLHHSVSGNNVYIRGNTVDLMPQKTCPSQKERTSLMTCQRTSSNEQRIATSLGQHSRRHTDRLGRIPKRSSKEIDSTISGQGQLKRDSSDEEAVPSPKQRRNT